MIYIIFNDEKTTIGRVEAYFDGTITIISEDEKIIVSFTVGSYNEAAVSKYDFRKMEINKK